MSRIPHLIKKEFIQLKRDKKMLPLVFIAPIFQLLIFGYAATVDVKHISTVVCDLDKTSSSRELIRSFKYSGYFDVNYYVDSSNEIEKYILYNKASVGLVIPRGFARKLHRGEVSQLQMIVDGSEPNSGIIGLNYARMIVQGYSQKIMIETFSYILTSYSVSSQSSSTTELTDESSVSNQYVNPTIRVGNNSLFEQNKIKIEWRKNLPMIDNRVRVWYNPEMKSVNYMVPGVICLLLLVVTTVLTALAIVKERERGTIEQLIVTPIKPAELMIGKLAPFIIIGFIDVAIVVTVGTLWFKVPIKGSLLWLFSFSALFLMTTVGGGLLASTFSKTQQQAMMSIVLMLYPFMLLSGFIFPIESMPKVIQYFTYLIPLRYFLVIVRGIFLKGAGIEVLWDEALILFLFGIVILGISINRFKKKL